MFNLFSQPPKKTVIVYDSDLIPCYKAKVNQISDDKKLKHLLEHSRLFLKVEDTYYYRTTN